jgi:hypothetical protein
MIQLVLPKFPSKILLKTKPKANITINLSRGGTKEESLDMWESFQNGQELDANQRPELKLRKRALPLAINKEAGKEVSKEVSKEVGKDNKVIKVLVLSKDGKGHLNKDGKGHLSKDGKDNNIKAVLNKDGKGHLKEDGKDNKVILVLNKDGKGSVDAVEYSNGCTLMVPTSA